VADNQLSAKLETAIQALDNITKTYQRFVNAEPRSSSQPITPARRYDAHLVPYDVLRQAQPALRSCYDGVSENVAGLIELILALKATLNDVYEKNTVNQTTFELTCRSFVYRTQQVFNPLMGTCNYSVTSNNMKLVHWPLMGGLLHLVQRAGDWAGPQPAQDPPRCTKCNSPSINGSP